MGKSLVGNFNNIVGSFVTAIITNKLCSITRGAQLNNNVAFSVLNKRFKEKQIVVNFK